jgi:hypothetical protein
MFQRRATAFESSGFRLGYATLAFALVTLTSRDNRDPLRSATRKSAVLWASVGREALEGKQSGHDREPIGAQPGEGPVDRAAVEQMDARVE